MTAAPVSAAPVSAAPAETSPGHWGTLALLAALGAILILVCLYWNRIALGGRLGVAPEWVHDLARPISGLHEALLGPIATDPPGTPQTHRIAQLAGSWVVGTLVYGVAVWLVLRRPERIGAVALDLIVAVSIVCRIVLIASPPMLETDPCRYVWDGAVLARGINPYRFAPQDVLRFREQLARPGLAPEGYGAGERAQLEALSEAADDPRLTWHFFYINHPEAPTVYPPVAQHLFALAYRIAPGSVYELKALIVLFDLGTLWLIALLLARLGRPPAWLLLYGWCPLVLKEYAQTGHIDPVANFFVLLALYALLCGWRLGAGASLGLAVLAKLYPLVLLPLCIRRLGTLGSAAFVLTVAGLWLPFVGIGSRAFAGMLIYSRDWVMNASIFSLLCGVLGDPAVAKAILGCGYLGLLIALMRGPNDRPEQLLRRSFVAIGALVLVSPVCDPWYLAWVLPLCALMGRVSWVVLSATMIAYYVYQGAGTYQLCGLDLRWVEYAPFYALLLIEERRPRV